MNLKEKLANLRDTLSQNLIERDTAIRLTLLAALTGEHLLLVGLPGTAKSELARRLKLGFHNANYFERLLTRFSVPEELFGPLSIKALEEDRYERLITRYLPDASIAFIDEIFKANSAILNSLLTLLNEREFDNGTQRLKTPLICVIGASNELPEGEDLDALYDRFLLRFEVQPVSDNNFSELLKLQGQAQPKPDLKLRLTLEELKEIQENAELVELSGDVIALLQELRQFLAQQQIYVSDRRWRKIVKLLQVSAYSNGELSVSIWDCWLLQHCTWYKPEQQAVIFDWYQQRVGTSEHFNPDNLAKLIRTWEQRLGEEQNAKTQIKDIKGKLLYLDENGKPTTDIDGEVPAYRKGEALYLAPANNQQRDRTNQNKGYTKEELLRDFYQNHYRQDWQNYIADEANRLQVTKKYPAHMQPMQYSKHHIDGRVKDVSQIELELSNYLTQVQFGLHP